MFVSRLTAAVLCALPALASVGLWYPTWVPSRRPRTTWLPAVGGVVTVVALEQCEMLKLYGRVFVEVLNQVPDVALALVRELALRLDVVTSRMLQPHQIT